MEQIYLRITGGNSVETFKFKEDSEGDFPGLKWNKNGNTFISFPTETYMFLFNRRYRTSFVKYVQLSGETKFILHTSYFKEVSDETYVNIYTGEEIKNITNWVDDFTDPLYEDLTDPTLVTGYVQIPEARIDYSTESKFFINNVGKANNIALFPVYLNSMKKQEGFIPSINIKSGSTEISHMGYVGFGEVSSGTTGNSKTFTVENLGTDYLVLYGIPKVSIDGPNALEFLINETSLNQYISGGTNSSFNISLAPISAGTKSAVIHIHSNDRDIDCYRIYLNGKGI